MTPKQQDIIAVPNYETGITENYRIGSFDKKESKREAQKIYELLLEKERVLTQLELLKEKISILCEENKVQSEYEVENIYKTIENNDDANFELAMYYFENDKATKGIAYLKKSISISNKHIGFVLNYINKYIIPEIKNGKGYKNDHIQVLFLKEFKDEVTKIVKTEISNSTGKDKEKLKIFLKYLNSLN
ncbi:MAG: hypothetical protein PHZ26_05395 [Candidatus Gracilibacteria bacterium]|nr:hypothetical protein [Candidatus Gracilibacteria bacterium]